MLWGAHLSNFCRERRCHIKTVNVMCIRQVYVYFFLLPSPSFLSPSLPLQDNIQRILLALAVKIDSTHRCFVKRRLLLSYNLFVKLVCRELRDGLDETQPFVVMDIVHTLSRVISGIAVATPTSGMGQLLSLCLDTLETLSKAVISACPLDLANHLPTLVACLLPFARGGSPDGQKVSGRPLVSLVNLELSLLLCHSRPCLSSPSSFNQLVKTLWQDSILCLKPYHCPRS